MEILNILYSNNLIAVYLIGAILVVILIFIVISSMTTTPKENNDILNDPIEDEKKSDIIEMNSNVEEKSKEHEISKIDNIVEELYQKTLNAENETKPKEDAISLDTFLSEFDVPENVIDEVVNNENQNIKQPDFIKTIQEIETPILKEDKLETKENIEDMLKKLYNLRQSETEVRKNALLNEIYDLKKQVDETLKANTNDYKIDYNYVDTKVLADYYLFNEDIEFPKLK